MHSSYGEAVVLESVERLDGMAYWPQHSPGCVLKRALAFYNQASRVVMLSILGPFLNALCQANKSCMAPYQTASASSHCPKHRGGAAKVSMVGQPCLVRRFSHSLLDTFGERV